MVDRQAMSVAAWACGYVAICDAVTAKSFGPGGVVSVIIGRGESVLRGATSCRDNREAHTGNQ
jgi:hypothetical protein